MGAETGAETGAESREGAGTGRGDGVGTGKEEAWERGQEREEEGREREGIGGKEWEVTGRKGAEGSRKERTGRREWEGENGKERPGGREREGENGKERTGGRKRTEGIGREKTGRKGAGGNRRKRMGGNREEGREGGSGRKPPKGREIRYSVSANCKRACICPRLLLSLHRRPALSLPAVGRGRKVRATQSTAQANDLISVRVWERNRKRPPARASSDAGQVRVKRRGKSPPRRQRCRPAVRPAGCKTVYTGSQGLLARCRGVGCWRRRVTAVVDK